MPGRWRSGRSSPAGSCRSRSTPGDAVAAGGQLLVIEAMKMQNELRSPRDGTIVRVGAAVGGTVEIGDLLVVIE